MKSERPATSLVMRLIALDPHNKEQPVVPVRRKPVGIYGLSIEQAVLTPAQREWKVPFPEFG